MFKMKKATYGSKRTIEYDENAPCILCGKPVIEVSMAGPTICPWCDSGCPRPKEVRRMTSSKQPGGRKTPCDGKGECSLCNRYDYCYYWQGAGCCPACGMPEGSCNCGKESDEEVR